MNLLDLLIVVAGFSVAALGVTLFQQYKRRKAVEEDLARAINIAKQKADEIRQELFAQDRLNRTSKPNWMKQKDK